MKKGNVTAVLPFRWMHAFDYFVCRETHGIPMIKGVSEIAQKVCSVGEKCARCFIIPVDFVFSVHIQHEYDLHRMVPVSLSYLLLILIS